MTGKETIPELHLKQLGFTYIACGPFTKHLERIKKFRETGNLKHVHRNELDHILLYLHGLICCICFKKIESHVFFRKKMNVNSFNFNVKI